MFRFTIRDVLGLMAVGALSCIVAVVFAPADPPAEMAAAVILFGFGGACYAGGIAVGRMGQPSKSRATII
jgi:hypothetical protein